MENILTIEQTLDNMDNSIVCKAKTSPILGIINEQYFLPVL